MSRDAEGDFSDDPRDAEAAEIRDNPRDPAAGDSHVKLRDAEAAEIRDDLVDIEAGDSRCDTRGTGATKSRGGALRIALDCGFLARSMVSGKRCASAFCSSMANGASYLSWLCIFCARARSEASCSSFLSFSVMRIRPSTSSVS